MKRMIMDQLIERKNRTDRKPMLLTERVSAGNPGFERGQFEDTAYFHFEMDSTIGSLFKAILKINVGNFVTIPKFGQ